MEEYQGVGKSLQEVSPGLGGGPREEHSLVREDWGHDGVEMEFRRRGWEGGKQR